MPASTGSEPTTSPAFAQPLRADAAARDSRETGCGDALDSKRDQPLELAMEDIEEVEEEIFGEMLEQVPPPSQNGFQVFLQGANLHNLLQVESLSRTTGVFLVTSQGRTGYIHLDHGELIHAEFGALSGEAAATEILSWGEGEFKSCSRALSPVVTIRSSLQSLLLRLATASDEAAESERRQPRPTTVRLREEDKPTLPHVTPPSPPAEAQRTSAPPPPPDAQRTSAAPPPPDAQRTSSPPPPRSHRMPPPLPPRLERDPASVAEVTLSASGEILQGRGNATEEFSARVAYAARLADLIGRAIRSGTPRRVELRGKSTQTIVNWQPDGTLTASLDLVQPGKR